jgi:aspartate-semialdehyde dehydrogenase
MERRDFPVADVRLLASPRSAGKTLAFRGGDFPVAALEQNSFAGIDLAFFSAGSGTSKQFAPLAQDAGAVVIDNSSAFRMDAEVPLIIPRSIRKMSARTAGSSRIRIARRRSR